MLAFTAREDTEVEKTTLRNRFGGVTEASEGFRLRRMNDADLDRILELRSVVRWSADPRAFDLLRGVRGARWAVTEGPDGLSGDLAVSRSALQLVRDRGEHLCE